MATADIRPAGSRSSKLTKSKASWSTVLHACRTNLTGSWAFKGQHWATKHALCRPIDLVFEITSSQCHELISVLVLSFSSSPAICGRHKRTLEMDHSSLVEYFCSHGHVLTAFPVEVEYSTAHSKWLSILPHIPNESFDR